MLISLSVPVISSSPWSSAAILSGMLRGGGGIWKSCQDCHSLKQLLSCSSKAGVSLYLAYPFFVAHTTDIHHAIFCFCPHTPPPCLLYISSASIPFFACELKAVTPYRRGFFCGDSTITYPYVEREAIPDSLLIAGGIAITGLTVRQWLRKHCVFAQWCCNLTVSYSFFSDCTGWMLPGPLLWRALTSLHSEPLRVMPIQRARKLLVWLLCGPVSHQYGKAKRGTLATQFPVCL